MAGIETLARLAGVKIPEPVRFALNPTAYLLGEIYKQIESSAGLPSKTFQTLSNPAGAAVDYLKTEAGNALLDQSNTSNIERILNELQPNQFEQVRAAGEVPSSVPSSIEAPQYDQNSLAGLGSLEVPDYFNNVQEYARDTQMADFGGGGGGRFGNDYYQAANAMANGGFIYRGNR